VRLASGNSLPYTRTRLDVAAALPLQRADVRCVRLDSSKPQLVQIFLTVECIAGTPSVASLHAESHLLVEIRLSYGPCLLLAMLDHGLVPISMALCVSDHEIVTLLLRQGRSSQMPLCAWTDELPTDRLQPA
jgi:hypothetical protein